jgi:alpha-D-xyloside xylohydrolase
VKAGLNMAMSGIPWWTTDIGGFYNGHIDTEYFRELIIRWFQFGVFCPIFRTHGYRMPFEQPLPQSGAGNEIWSFGDEVYKILAGLLALRERLRPYIHEIMQVTSNRGIPPLRPLFLEFPDDPVCETIEDQFMFGPEILVAPVLWEGCCNRKVYLPIGTDWLDAWTGKTCAGGQTVEVPAPLAEIPVFLKSGSRLTSVFHPS